MEEEIIRYLTTKIPQDKESAKILARFFVLLNIKPTREGLTNNQTKAIFGLLLKDYKDFKIDADTLAVLCDKLYLLTTDKNKSDSNYLLDVADLDWALRHDPVQAGKILDKIRKIGEGK